MLRVMRVNRRIVIAIETGEVLYRDDYTYSGPVDKACGSSSQQNQIESSQQSFYNTLTAESQQVFGQGSALYANMLKVFQPIFDAGPNQKGFSPEESAALDTQATEGVASNYDKAATALGEQAAGAGGGNEYIPSGEAEQQKDELASAAAGQESSEQNQILEDNYATGRENWEAAEQGLLGAGGVYSPATALFGQTTNAGSAASETADQIAQENNSWMGAVGGMLGAAAGGWASGGFKVPG